MMIQINIDMTDEAYHVFNKRHEDDQAMIQYLFKFTDEIQEQLNNCTDLDATVYLHCIDDEDGNTLYD